jgi:hypothetical protein
MVACFYEYIQTDKRTGEQTQLRTDMTKLTRILETVSCESDKNCFHWSEQVRKQLTLKAGLRVL